MKLSGIKVVDLSVFLPGPYTTQMLADHGAEVIKIENPGEGDPARTIGPAYGVASVFFHNVNRGKKSVALDLKTPAGRENLLRLCDDADVFVESFRPGAVKRLGVDYEVVRARNPRIVYCSISAFGQTGPYRNRPAHDLAVQAISGAQSLTLGMDGRPAMTGVAVADIVSGLHALSGILMALLRARTTGRGDYIDISMHEAALASFPNVLGPVFASGEQPDVGKSRTGGGAAFYQIYETKDGRHLALGGQEPKFAAALLTWLDRPDLLPVCALPPGSQEPVIAFLRERFLSKTLAEWQEELAALDVCFGPVNSLPEALADPHVAEREIVLIDAAGRRHLAPVIRFRDEPARISFAVPGHGEHTGATLGTASATRAT